MPYVKEMREYELMFIIRPDVPDEKKDIVRERIKEYIKNLGGEFIKEDIWGIRKFAYEIEGFEEGYYVIFYFKLAPSEVKELWERLNLSQDVLRFMFVKRG